MTLAITYSRANLVLDAPLVTIETHISNGLPAFHIVGLANTAVKESKDRVRSAILNSQFEFPARRITVNLAPADLPKDGGRYDLAIALGILAASGQINSQCLLNYEFAGELALTGELRAIKGVLPFALASAKMKNKLIIPLKNSDEAALCDNVTIIATDHLLKVIAHLNNNIPIAPLEKRSTINNQHYNNDMSEVKGQHQTKRALEIAAAGRHNILMKGPPGTGKTMLAQRLSSILPELSKQEALEVCAIKSITKNKMDTQYFFMRPFRAPHHSASNVALVGGGNPPRPGEISLAHHGILFLDEIPEFNRKTLEVLREPISSKSINISRAGYHINFPANFQLVGAMNPCPCGFLGDNQKQCRCTAYQIRLYQNKLSGPLLDRIDVHVDVPRLKKSFYETQKTSPEESSKIIKKRVTHAWERQQKRGIYNGHLDSNHLERYCALNKKNRTLVISAIEKLQLSSRGHTRILRVARTIADLENKDTIEWSHLSEAMLYQPRYW